MKKHFAIILVLLATLGASAQNSSPIKGTWNGALNIQGVQLRIVFHIETTDNGYSATMDSPDQNAFGLPVSSVIFSDSTLTINASNAGINYTGKLNADGIVGTFKQGSMNLPLILSRKEIEKVEPKRPQDPVKPYPYYTEDVTFYNPKAKITLAGTLSLPSKKGEFPVVVFISGSGAQNRDEEILGHKPFLIIADYLARNGIASLRFDDRGTAKSGGSHKDATSADFATDVESAVAYLRTRKETKSQKIGLIGHSEGGIIAPMVASKSNDVNFVVLLAGTGIRGDKLLLLQQELILRASGESESGINKTLTTNKELFELITSSSNDEDLKKNLINKVRALFDSDTTITIPKGIGRDEYLDIQIQQITNPWMLYFLRYDPSDALKKTKCPILAINGKKDLQVPANVNLPAIANALEQGGNKNVTIKYLPNLNHLFQECETGHPNEYSAIEQTISPDVLELVAQWIKQVVE